MLARETSSLGAHGLCWHEQTLGAPLHPNKRPGTEDHKLASDETWLCRQGRQADDSSSSFSSTTEMSTVVFANPCGLPSTRSWHVTVYVFFAIFSSFWPLTTRIMPSSLSNVALVTSSRNLGRAGVMLHLYPLPTAPESSNKGALRASWGRYLSTLGCRLVLTRGLGTTDSVSQDEIPWVRPVAEVLRPQRLGFHSPSIDIPGRPVVPGIRHQG
jgi:hypothetical protein